MKAAWERLVNGEHIIKNIASIHGLFIALGIFSVSVVLPQAIGQTPNGTLIYQDDFSVSNAVWQFGFRDTRGNSTAVATSYGKIEAGCLQLKSNVGCGWDYLVSIASLQKPLPNDYIVEFQLSKAEWCGPFLAIICGTNDLPDTVLATGAGLPQVNYTFGLAGSWFQSLCVQSSASTNCVSPTTSSFNYDGTWYGFKVIKIDTNLVIFVNGSRQWSYSGPVIKGGFLHLATYGAGAAVKVDNLKLYELISPKVHFVKAFTLDYSDVSIGSNYQLQASSNLIDWTNWGVPFTANSMSYTNTISYQRIDNWSQLFFRLQPQ